jgi:poly-gamma-glutamate capsule biosynthesis protein CapA/YwtB (metallophosphatase superfamily)
LKTHYPDGKARLPTLATATHREKLFEASRTAIGLLLMAKTSKMLVFVLTVALVYSCKTARVSQRTTPASDTLQLAQVDSLPIGIVKEVNVEEVIKTATDSSATSAKVDTISIIAVGDIMMGTNYPNNSYLPPAGTNLLRDVKHILRDANVTFGNLEGVLLNEGGNPKYCRNPDVCYLFRSPEYMAGNLKSAGFDVVSVANNHTGDFGAPGRTNTARILDSLGISYAGTLQKRYSTFTLDSIKYGFVAFAPNKGTVSIHNSDAAKAMVQKLDSLCDIVIVSFHGGAEGKNHQHVPKSVETYFGENRGDVHEFAHMMVDAGADMIFGHGPHVTRAVEVYNGRFIAYSLGNFCTYARFNLSGPNGIAPIIKIFVDHQGIFLSGQIFPIRQIGSGVPVLDENKEVIGKIRELTLADFPESLIDVDGNGNIHYLKASF